MQQQARHLSAHAKLADLQAEASRARRNADLKLADGHGVAITGTPSIVRVRARFASLHGPVRRA